MAADYPERVRLIAFADSTADLQALEAGLEDRGLPLTIAPDDGDGGPADGPAATASALISSERVLVERRPAAVVLAGAGDRVLAAGLAASKLEVPLISLLTETAGGGGAERNSRLLALLSDLVVDVDENDPAGTIHAWLQAASGRSGGAPAGG